MRRLPWRVTLPVLGVVIVALTALHAAIAPAAVNRAGANDSAASREATVINVTMGKPSELAFTLSKTSMVPAGAITFKVTNSGAGYHNFKVCAKAVASA